MWPDSRIFYTSPARLTSRFYQEKTEDYMYNYNLLSPFVSIIQLSHSFEAQSWCPIIVAMDGSRSRKSSALTIVLAVFG